MYQPVLLYKRVSSKSTAPAIKQPIANARTMAHSVQNQDATQPLFATTSHGRILALCNHAHALITRRHFTTIARRGMNFYTRQPTQPCFWRQKIWAYGAIPKKRAIKNSFPIWRVVPIRPIHFFGRPNIFIPSSTRLRVAQPFCWPSSHTARLI